jgi:surface carbohydrate biosynthesis protein
MGRRESPNFAMDLQYPLGHWHAEIPESLKPLSAFPKRAILPCEIKSREFDSKLLLACFLAERGWTSVVGSRNEIHMRLHRIPRSIYLGKDIRFSSSTIVTMLRLLGHRFLAMDEEAQFFLSRERYRKSRVDDYVLSHAEALFAWGPENALAWKQAPAYKGQPIHLSGNGRIDMLRPETRALCAARCAELKARYGDFILVNTNFGAINHFMSNLSANVNDGDKEPAMRGHDNGYLVHRQKLLCAFLTLLPAMAKRFPKTKIILRPHPAENHDVWREALNGYPGVEINSEGSVIPWLLASRALVHNGCTTGSEAYILGKVTLAFQPVMSKDFDLHVPNELSFSVKTEAELFKMLDQVMQGKLTYSDLQSAERNKILENSVSATDGDLATQRIADVLDEFVSVESVPSTNMIAWPVGAAVTLARAAIKHYNRNRPGHKSNVAYTRHRFPHTELTEVQTRIAEFASCLDYFSGFSVREDSENVFIVSPTRS